MTWGKQMDFLLQMEEELGEPPQALKDRPILEAHLRYYQRVFVELSDDRLYSSMGTPMMIPVSAFQAYCELFYIDSLQEREAIYRTVRTLDRAYVKELSKASEKTDT